MTVEIPKVRRLNTSGEVEVDEDLRRLWDEYLIGPKCTDGVDALSQPGLPVPGDKHPERAEFIFLERSRIRVTPDPLGRGHFRVRYPYVDGVAMGSNQSATRRISRSSLLIDHWRQPPFAPLSAFGGINTPGKGPNNDIGGIKIDSGGGPATLPVHIHDIIIEVPFASADLPELLIAALQNTRNATTWRGYGPGTVVYLGADTFERRGSLPQLVHMFRFDAFWHVRQLPHRLGGGHVPLDDDGHARYVNFVQPFPTLANFNVLTQHLSGF